ncbi:diacylglycerol kinase family protein [Neolewinella lacunae]|uniref:DAGKc domain-containing protein n=1 Tax=Neolewinella lacunae TaxID=1517758 RepID=A0A923PL71_9BACT|nr:diacylglycerol kinase family protein [Neolewinella lacunae]MBC6995414.1 hypothetical protein [Neolewinella lacunae]MDN3633843.1 diacylglycerol kinase family protein [Neolewinella lacunae]
MKPPIPHWHFLVNPAAGRGRAARKWARLLPRLQAALPGMTWAESDAENSLTVLAEAAVRAGRLRLVGVGGDGTHHDILNGIVAAGNVERVLYAPFPLGSGNDWVRTLGTPRQLSAWLATLHAGHWIDHAIGNLVYYRTPSGPRMPAIRSFLNVAGMAYDAEVVRRAEKARFKHRLLYPLLTLAYLRDFTAPTVRIDYDGQAFQGPVHTVNFGIGRYNGGGMRLVPQADPERPDLALTFAPEFSIAKILLHAWRFYTASIGRVPGVVTAHASQVGVAPTQGTLELEADGEWLGYGPVTVRLDHRRLRVVVPAGRRG